MAKKIYAVRKGRNTGIFESWAACKEQVDGYSGAEYKSFFNREDAENFLGNLSHAASSDAEESSDPDTAIAYVDGSYDKTSGDFSCGMVFMFRGEEITFHQRFSDPELSSMHNVAGEIKGAEAAMRYAKEHQIKKLVIYHDYEGIAKWCNGAWKANKEGTKAYKRIYEEMAEDMEIRFEKVKGHSGDRYNDMADHLAKKALGL